MQEPNRLIGCSDFPELAFVKREATPEQAMRLGIQLHLAGLSLADTVSVLAGLGVERCRSTVHNWIRKADLQPTEGYDPNYVVGDETVIRVNEQQYWLFAAVDPDTDRLLHVRLFPTRTQALTEMVLTVLREKHLVDGAIFLVDGAPWLQAAYYATRSDSNISPTGIGMPLNASSKSSDAELKPSPTTSDTLDRTQQKRGSKHSPSVSIS
ncbi:DDE domain-containing protein [Halobellus limi]|uniref:DDE domain-containing protein n=1 Tax=Halobellus limi TaxID=699433 RepID=A0A1H6BP65_9EURY|nr:DDE domain-containing protein [Halobellus limi]